MRIGKGRANTSARQSLCGTKEMLNKLRIGRLEIPEKNAWRGRAPSSRAWL